MKENRMEQNRNNDLSDHARLALEYLEQVHFWQSQADGLKEQIGMQKLRSLSLPSPSDCSPEKVSCSPAQDAPFESSVGHMDLLERELAELTARLEPLKAQAVRIVKQHTTLIQQRVLLLHYINGYPWGLVASMVSRTDRQVYRIRLEALEQVVLPKDAIWLD